MKIIDCTLSVEVFTIPIITEFSYIELCYKVIRILKEILHEK